MNVYIGFEPMLKLPINFELSATLINRSNCLSDYHTLFLFQRSFFLQQQIKNFKHKISGVFPHQLIFD